MQWSKKIISVNGIPIKLHLSLVLLFIWIFMARQEKSSLEALLSFVFLLGSVTMHELAHALTAKHFGIRTRDITLYPFGGIAVLLDKISARQELFITIAGPLSNLLLAVLIAFNSNLSSYNIESFLTSALGELFIMNVALGIFNLIPAFPMDGGRILRAALQLCNVKHTNLIVSRTSQAICILLAALALIYSNPVLFVIAVFIFGNASKELMLTEARQPVKSMQVAEVMIPINGLVSLSPSATIESAAKFALKTAQTHFPVMLGEQFLGLVGREDILHKAVSDLDSNYITEIMLKNIPDCPLDASLDTAMQIFEQNFADVLLINKDNNPIGLIFKDQLESLILIQQVLEQNERHRELQRSIEL